MTRRLIRAPRVLLALLVLAAGCSAGAGSSTTPEPVEPVQVPYLAMSTATSGALVWPVGSDWVVLGTTDGFAHVTNRTPVGVNTEGGLSTAVLGPAALVAVGTTDRLLRSPVLSAKSGWRWQPGELPGAVAKSIGSVTITPDASYAVLTGHGGTLARSSGGTGAWTTLTDGVRLSHTSGFTLDAVDWSGRDGIVVGHGENRTATAYRTSDDGATWTPVAGTSGRSVAASRPCGRSSGWSVPVVDDAGALRMVSIGGVVGRPVTVGTGAVALGCAGTSVMVIDDKGVVDVSHDSGGHWHPVGRAPADVTALAPTGSGAGFATSGGRSPALWRFSADGAHFSRVRLPDWIAALGGQGGVS